MSLKIKDIQAWLEDDQDAGVTKEASADSTGSLMEKMASQFEDEQFEKLANDSWMMGQIMGESFINALEKNALAEVDDRIAGDISSNGHAHPAAVNQALGDKERPQNCPSPVLEPLIQKLINKKVGEGASVSGEDPRTDGHRLLQPVPVAADVSGTDAVKKAAARELIKELLQDL